MRFVKSIGSSWIIFFLALAVRIGYYFFGTPVYFGKSGYQIWGDTGAWRRCAQNLIEHGVYSMNLAEPVGAFFRPPGYGLFMIPFYLITGNWEDAYPLMAWVQIILDCFAAVLMFKLGKLIFGNKTAAWICGIAYSFYFFALGWTPVLYPESLANFFLIAGVFLFLKAISLDDKAQRLLFFSAILIGIAVLFRIQLVLLLPAPLLVLIWKYVQSKKKKFILLSLLYIVGLSMSYGLWPLRNAVLHGEPVFLAKNGNYGLWAHDHMGFLNFVLAVKVDHEPQHAQILANEEVAWPKGMNLSRADSLLLIETVSLMQECGIATQHWKRNTNNVYKNLNGADCNEEISRNWDVLIDNQKTHNTFHYWVTVPCLNMKKAIFKFDLKNKNESIAVSLMFILRTILLISGLVLSVIMIYQGSGIIKDSGILILLCWLGIYVGIAVFYRNIDMRYFMQADSLLLLPLGHMGEQVIKRLKLKLSN